MQLSSSSRRACWWHRGASVPLQGSRAAPLSLARRAAAQGAGRAGGRHLARLQQQWWPRLAGPPPPSVPSCRQRSGGQLRHLSPGRLTPAGGCSHRPRQAQPPPWPPTTSSSSSSSNKLISCRPPPPGSERAACQPTAAGSGRATAARWHVGKPPRLRCWPAPKAHRLAPRPTACPRPVACPPQARQRRGLRARPGAAPPAHSCHSCTAAQCCRAHALRYSLNLGFALLAGPGGQPAAGLLG